jgi:integrase/recombinase XerD
VPSKEVEAFFEHITVIKALSKNTLLAYKNDLAEFEEVISKSAIKADTKDVLTFLSGFDNAYTLNRKLSSVNSFFEFCHRQNWVDDKPLIRHSKLPQNLPKFLEPKFILDSVEAVPQESWLGLRDKAFILFLYASGCRVSEALMAKRSDIEDGWLKIRSAKGEKERIVPMAAVALEALDRYMSARSFKGEVLWLNYKGTKLSRISAFKITQSYLGVSPHTLRHSFATSLIIGGADIGVVQELLGHVSINTTQIYTHIKKQNLQDTVMTYHPLRGGKF